MQGLCDLSVFVGNITRTETLSVFRNQFTSGNTRKFAAIF